MVLLLPLQLLVLLPLLQLGQDKQLMVPWLQPGDNTETYFTCEVIKTMYCVVVPLPW